MTHATLKAPFPWFGGKSRAAPLIWSRLGDVDHYIEPFAGSLATLLARPHAPRMETVNDKDAFICNFWRAVQMDPESVARHANYPINETDLYSRHAWLRKRTENLAHTLKQHPDYYNPKIAGYWVWGISQWIGDGWCSGKHWHCRPDINSSGRGIHTDRVANDIHQIMRALRDRLLRVRVICGDWKRVVSTGVIRPRYTTGVLLDPPYGDFSRKELLYAHDGFDIAAECLEWCRSMGQQPNVRIALCGFEGEHNALEREGWQKVEWIGHGGYGNFWNKRRPNLNREKERIWFSPRCAAAAQPDLFDPELCVSAPLRQSSPSRNPVKEKSACMANVDTT